MTENKEFVEDGPGYRLQCRKRKNFNLAKAALKNDCGLLASIPVRTWSTDQPYIWIEGLMVNRQATTHPLTRAAKKLFKPDLHQGGLEFKDATLAAHQNVHAVLKPKEQLAPKIKVPKLDKERHLILPDGGTVSVCFYYPVDDAKYDDPTNPGIYIIPGLTSSHLDVPLLINPLISIHGFPVVVLNRRGLGTELTTPEFYLSGNDSDMYMQMEYVRSRKYFRNRPMFAIGISMGGSSLIRYLGKYNSKRDRKMDGIVGGFSECSPLEPRDIFIRKWSIEYLLLKFVKETFVYPYVNRSHADWVKVNPNITEEHWNRQKAVFERLRDCDSILDFLFLHFQLYHPDYAVPPNIADLVDRIKSGDRELFQPFQDYDASNFVSHIKVPFLMINASDDGIVSLCGHSFQLLLNKPCKVSHLQTDAGNHTYYRSPGVNDEFANIAEEIAISYFREILESKRIA